MKVDWPIASPDDITENALDKLDHVSELERIADKAGISIDAVRTLASGTELITIEGMLRCASFSRIAWRNLARSSTGIIK